ncbi:MAG TPA: hypothetical protein PLU54_05250 [Deltaproteobacteria bacterium]|nr:hypothetical protein [Deltaproteobacteria bacterium]
MHPSRYRRSDLFALFLAWCLFLAAALFPACGGKGSASGGDSGGNDGNSQVEPGTDTWQRVAIATVSDGGLLLPQVKAVHDGTGMLHISYFDDSTYTDGHYTLHHVAWDMVAEAEVSREQVVDVDNCRTLAAALDPDGMPLVAYQGGQVRAGGSEQQSDVMVSVLQGSTWREYTGGIGFVERNPVFEDGLAGKHVAMAVDGTGLIHLCYQFFYEGIDAMNFNYPDLLHVAKDRAALDSAGEEVTVEGNMYNPNGTASEQNRVGAHAAMVIDAQGNPAVFYSADLAPNMSDSDTKGLRVAIYDGQAWQREWVEQGFEVSGISCGLDAQGNLCVAYSVEGEYTDSRGVTHGRCLKFATRIGTAWTTSFVDESTHCGQHCSLAFDASGNPAIAYYALQNHSGSLILKDLMLARRSGTVWDRQTVASTGDIGTYNTLLFDNSGSAWICTYSGTDRTIYLFHR